MANRDLAIVLNAFRTAKSELLRRGWAQVRVQSDTGPTSLGMVFVGIPGWDMAIPVLAKVLNLPGNCPRNILEWDDNVCDSQTQAIDALDLAIAAVDERTAALTA